MPNLDDLGGSNLLDDGFSLKKKDRGEEVDMDITPMIDITFLLLIFFLVASKMQEPARVDLPAAVAGTEVQATESIDIIIRGIGGGKGKTAEQIEVKGFDGTVFDSSDDDVLEQALGQYIEAGLAGTPPFEGPKKHIILRAEGSVREGDVERVMKVIARATEDRTEERKISVINIAVMDKD